MPRLVLLCFALAAIWVVRRDIRSREGISGALWIPTLWLAILGSRPFSMWIGGDIGGGGTSLEGNTTDAAFYLFLIVAAFFICVRRGINWGAVASCNRALFLFYGYFLISVLWSEHSFSSFKRLFKDFGDVVILMVILTEENPREAIKSVFVRLGYVLIPLSYLLIRYFPDIGRRYNVHNGMMEAVGVTTQKNQIGAVIMICGMIILYDLLDRSNRPGGKWSRLDRFLRWGTLGIGIYLLRVCDSKTSMLCLVIGAGMLFSTKVPSVQRNLGVMAKYVIAGVLAFVVLDYFFGLKDILLHMLGRDATLTGRTDVWQYLLDLHTNPIIGMGYCTIWDSHFKANFPIWMADSAHNGYLEMYLDGGWIGEFFLILLVAGAYRRAGRRMASGSLFSVLRFAVVIITILYNVSEAMFARLSPGWFLFLLFITDAHPEADSEEHADEHEVEEKFAEPIPSGVAG